MIDPRAYVPLNWGMIQNPWNWAILVLMVSIAGVGLALIFPSVASQPSAAK